MNTAKSLLQIQNHLYTSFTSEGEVSLGDIKWKSLSEKIRMGLQRLCKEGIDEDEVVDSLDSQKEMIVFYSIIERCRVENYLQENLLDQGKKFATFIPYVKQPSVLSKSIERDLTITLNRFAYVTWKNGSLTLKSPHSLGEIQFESENSLLLLNQIAKGTTLSGLQKQALLSDSALDLLFSYLLHLKLITTEGKSLSSQWEFHDALFHVKSRLGRHSNPYGGCYPFKNKLPSPPVVKPPMSTDVVSLYKPDLKEISKNDLSLTEAIEQRKSLRHSKTKMSSKQLGEFLYRTARVKEILKNDNQDLSKRAYPGGGAIYELEVYPLVYSVEDLKAGLYHYNPLEHTLEMIKNELCTEQEKLLNNAAQSVMRKDYPQMMLIISARFDRMSWKYRSMAYSATLKNVGVLYQNFYLVATAMGLSPCALGGGNSSIFSSLIDEDYFTETSVGEFLLEG